MSNEAVHNATVSRDEQKILVARTAIDDLIAGGIIHSGMKIGLGTGSTAMPAVSRLAEHLKNGDITDIRAVATSFQTTIACEELEIPVFSMNAREIGGHLDLAIDGADEISPEKHLIKGGGAALLREKIVAYNADHFVVVADESKAVPDLATRFPLPVEVVSEARTSVTAALAALGASVTLRLAVKKAGPVITDNGNLILDCLWPALNSGAPHDTAGKTPIDPACLENEINKIAGVVENGFFTRNIPTVYIAHADGSIEKR